ncbi:DUF262 domain-containing protein [[Mycoplasma] testudinis]|uniref:DUF262 domain-containing protein n=1 Tax=[Mycoplasma] testudinis TaxID=33924 RepID=UPI000ADD4722|nr:DUF262 domain-containing protein [[Mycoplasma] testudinis]
MQNKTVESRTFTLSALFKEKFSVDYYQRGYVWEKKHLEDLINDLSNAFLKNWNENHKTEDVINYDPYFMGEIILSTQSGNNELIIDGQQRITTLTLLLIYILQKFGNVGKFPKSYIQELIYSDYYGTRNFNLDIKSRTNCMQGLFQKGDYEVTEQDEEYIKNIVDIYKYIEECWNEKIDEKNIANFAYWIKEKILFSKVWTNSDEFAYIIFETMNDRGVNLTSVEMLRSYLLSNIEKGERQHAINIFDLLIKSLNSIKLKSKSKAVFEFFKVYLRCHHAEDFSQSKEKTSDFVKIGNEFHRWVSDHGKDDILGLKSSTD